MWIFSRSKRQVIDCFTYNQTIADHFSIQSANHYIPTWWKNLPSSLPRPDGFQKARMGTMKRCFGFIELFQRSWVLPLWTDINIELVTEDGKTKYRWIAADHRTDMGPHDYQQMNGSWVPNEQQHFKITAPWIVSSKISKKFMFSEPTWNMGSLIKDITVLPGIMDFRSQNAVNINLMARYPSSGTNSILMEANMPVYMITPLSEHTDIEFRSHVVSVEEFIGLSHQSKFLDHHKEALARLATYG